MPTLTNCTSIDFAQDDKSYRVRHGVCCVALATCAGSS